MKRERRLDPNLGDKLDKYLIVYYNESGTCFQVVRPTRYFQGDWQGLAYAVSNSDDLIQNYYSYEIKRNDV